MAATLSTAAIAATAIPANAIAAAKLIALTTAQKAIIGAALVAAIGTGIHEARRASGLGDELQALQQQQVLMGEQIQQLRHERDEGLAALRGENERLNHDKAELLRLRGEVGVLRQQTNELARLREENVKLHQAQPETQAPSEMIWELVRYKEVCIRIWLQAFFAYAKGHEGQCPESFMQAVSFLPESAFAVAKTANQFEILRHGSLDAIQGQDIIVFREKSLWQHVGGKWGRFYGNADGNAQYCSSSDKTATGSFEPYESAHTVPSPSQSEGSSDGNQK